MIAALIINTKYNRGTPFLYNKTEQSINPSYLEVITICDLQFSNSLCINSQLV